MLFEADLLLSSHALLAEATTRKQSDDIIVMFRDNKPKRRRLQNDTKKVTVKSVGARPDEKRNIPLLRKSKSRSALSKVEQLSPKNFTAMSNLVDRYEEAKSAFNANLQHENASAEYEANRNLLVRTELDEAWDAQARSCASPAEMRAQKIVFKIREHERSDTELFGELPGEAIPDEKFSDMGGEFLANLDRIRRSKIFKIASEMPKGCHQHLHFNSEIPPEHLFPFARSQEMQETMFIRSTQPLLQQPSDFDRAEIVFNVLPRGTPSADIYSTTYRPEWKNTSNSPWMLWSQFRERFPLRSAPATQLEGLDAAESWARNKMIVNVEAAHGHRAKQTHNRAWACFNQGTRAFKGLLGYESIYRWYIGHAIDSMIRDKVMYAELRPMLLDKTIPSNDGTRHLNHKDQMNIILEEVKKKMAELDAKGELDKFPFGLKIIYCTPRSITREKMKTELDDCLRLKLQFPDLVCGFDLVGAEDRPNCIRFYADLLVAFQKTCDSLGISIPFMFHAGETLLDTGGSSDPENSNLYDALLLKAKRIGHGYALLKHPVLTQRYKEDNICLELCPISNELLRLCGNAREHPFPQILAAGLHCTLNADNPSLFSSSLSHEFYQVMVGDPRMTIHGWKQLAEWSIEHSCLRPSEIEKAKSIYADAWEAFCQWVIRTYGSPKDSLMEIP